MKIFKRFVNSANPYLDYKNFMLRERRAFLDQKTFFKYFSAYIAENYNYAQTKHILLQHFKPSGLIKLLTGTRHGLKARLEHNARKRAEYHLKTEIELKKRLQQMRIYDSTHIIERIKRANVLRLKIENARRMIRERK